MAVRASDNELPAILGRHIVIDERGVGLRATWRKQQATLWHSLHKVWLGETHDVQVDDLPVVRSSGHIDDACEEGLESPASGVRFRAGVLGRVTRSCGVPRIPEPPGSRG